ncbi:BQ5605_C007g04726 [Microbotryum silenes-dioicae]|uniref:BQ5605_C007g04726 protein n=1 Tax=Microbotryum silenes-dioicae TaxID=796604 RepID=A0A2X0MAW6_9BASI|nr:BQ5605_C007g04726 [Microbotryum silenes-dioicae]
MREKGARHLPSGIAAALQRVSAPRHRNTTGKAITLEDDEDEDEDEWRKKMRMSTCRHVEVFMCRIRQFHVSDQIDLLRSDQDQINQVRIRKIQIRSDQITVTDP